MQKLKYTKRLLDRKPMACHLYVTDRCNLDCHYCAEFDNEVPHPDLEDLKRWSTRAGELGCLHMGLQGGEPLLYPHIVEVVRHCKELGFTVSLSTNGFLLTPELSRDLGDVGLDTLQISVDRMNPVASTRKSLKTIIPKLDCLKDSPFNVQVSGVLFEDTLPECGEVLSFAMSKGFSTHFRLVHPDPKQNYRVPMGDKAFLNGFIEEMMLRKAKGEKIHSTWAILDYQKGLLNGETLDWTCVAGYKYFFISSQESYYFKKECQTSCGVYCVITASLVYEHPVKFLTGELGLGRKEKLAGREPVQAGGVPRPQTEPLLEIELPVQT